MVLKPSLESTETPYSHAGMSVLSNYSSCFDLQGMVNFIWWQWIIVGQGHQWPRSPKVKVIKGQVYMRSDLMVNGLKCKPASGCFAHI